MTTRLDFLKHVDAMPMQALTAVSAYVHESEIDPQLRTLIDLRASQLNGCSYCIDMHTKDLLAMGTPLPRIYLLPAWRETAIYSPAERAALGWTEAVTELPDGDSLERSYGALAEHYSPRAITQLTFAVIAINSWNRLNVAFGREPEDYRTGDLLPRFVQALQRFEDLRPVART